MKPTHHVLRSDAYGRRLSECRRGTRLQALTDTGKLMGAKKRDKALECEMSFAYEVTITERRSHRPVSAALDGAKACIRRGPEGSARLVPAETSAYMGPPSAREARVDAACTGGTRRS
jgi:hypothetical protein